MNTAQNSTIIDVRSESEFAGRHVPGAINIPLDQLPQRIEEIRDLPKPVIVYCMSGNRSGMAMNLLMQQGINEVVTGGGISDMLNGKN